LPPCHILKLKCTKFDFGWGSSWGLLLREGRGGRRAGKSEGGEKGEGGPNSEARGEGRGREGGKWGRGIAPKPKIQTSPMITYYIKCSLYTAMTTF